MKNVQHTSPMTVGNPLKMKQFNHIKSLSPGNIWLKNRVRPQCRRCGLP